MRGVQLKLKSNPVDLMSPEIRLCENRPHVIHVNNTHVLEVITHFAVFAVFAVRLARLHARQANKEEFSSI